MVAELDAALRHLADIVKRDLGHEVNDIPGAGAAGGLGGGLIAFLDAELSSGVDIVLDTVGLGEALDGADLVITGEGTLDHQTVYNKAPIGVAGEGESAGYPGSRHLGLAGGAVPRRASPRYRGRGLHHLRPDVVGPGL